MKFSISLSPFSIAFTGGNDMTGPLRAFAFLVGWNNGWLFNAIGMVIDNSAHAPMNWARCYLRLKQYQPVRWQRVTIG